MAEPAESRRGAGQWPLRVSPPAACRTGTTAGRHRPRTRPGARDPAASHRQDRRDASPGGAEKEYHALAEPITHAKGWSTASARSRRWQASTLPRPADRSSALDPQGRGQWPCGQHAVHPRLQRHRGDRRPMQDAGPEDGTFDRKLSARETEDSSQEEIRR